MPPLDIAALAWFFLLWAGYNLIVDWILQRPLGLNQHMGLVRGAWMAAMLKRDDRVIDAILDRPLIHSVTFFASTTMLLVAALVGILGRRQPDLRCRHEPELHGHDDQALVRAEAPAADRHLRLTPSSSSPGRCDNSNHACALVGAMPASLAPGRQPAPVRSRPGASSPLAVINFNGGLRAYYFALAVLSWLVHPVLFTIVSAWMLLVLVRRQVRLAHLRGDPRL